MSLQSRNIGLDTLSIEELKSLTHRWTGEVSAVDTTSYDNVVSEERFNKILEQWHNQKAMERGLSPEELFGEDSELMTISDSQTECVIDSISSGSPVVEGVDTLGGTDSLDIAQSAVDMVAVASPTQSQILVWGEWLFSGLMIVTIVAYLYCMYRYYEDVVAMFASVFRTNSMLTQRIRERRHSSLFYGFLGKLIFVGVLFVWLLSMGFILHGGVGIFALPVEQTLLIPLAVVVGFVLLTLVQHAFLSVVGYITQSQSIAKALIRTRAICFVFMTIVVAPLLLISLTAPQGIYAGWLYVAGAMFVVTIIIYMKESLGLFIYKKVSILHWILYLCVVEVLPLSFLWRLIQSELGS